MNISEIDFQIKQLENEIKQVDLTDEILDGWKKYHGEDEILSSHQLRKLLDNEPVPQWSLMTQLPRLDDITGGFQGGDLVVLSAPTAAGKTKLTETFTRNLAEQKVGICFFSFEVTNRQLLDRFGPNLPFFYIPKKLASSSLKWVEERTIEAIAKSELHGYPLRGIVLDHLHYLFDLAQVRQPSLELGAIVRLLKKMALKWNIVVFLIAHTNKIENHAQITMASIRDSSFISQEADFVIMLERKPSTDGIKIYEDKTKVSVHKNRRTGQTGFFEVQIVDHKFVEITKNDYQPSSFPKTFFVEDSDNAQG